MESRPTPIQPGATDDVACRNDIAGLDGASREERVRGSDARAMGNRDRCVAGDGSRERHFSVADHPDRCPDGYREIDAPMSRYVRVEPEGYGPVDGGNEHEAQDERHHRVTVSG